jgi:AraC-like DNA-binding protein
MRYFEALPSRALADDVQLLWAMELDDPGSFGPPERILPDGIVEVVFHYGDVFEMRYPGKPWTELHRSVAVSQTDRFVEIRPSGASGFVSVRFFPWGAHRFFRVPVDAFADRALPAEHLWGRDVRVLEERLAAAASFPARIRLLEGFLLDRLCDGRMRRPLPVTRRTASGVVRLVQARGGRLSMARLSKEAGLGERRLERMFRRVVGVPPKRYARLCRFLDACRLLREARITSVAQVAMDCGYSDQPHLQREFRRLAGMTPAEFRGRRDVAFLGQGSGSS